MTTTHHIIAGSVVNDGYITGVLRSYKSTCPRCKAGQQRCIEILSVVLPEGVTLKATILQDRSEEDPKSISHIGLTCGCYARFHRQIAIIRERLHVRR